MKKTIIALCIGAMGLCAQTAFAADGAAKGNIPDLKNEPNLQPMDWQKDGKAPKDGRGPGKKDFGKFMARHLDRLHDDLKLNASQEEGWKAYRASLEATFKRPGDREAEKAMHAPERLEKHIKELSAHLVVLKSFYGKLTPEQQKLFDTESWPRGPRDRRGGSRGDRRGPPRD